MHGGAERCELHTVAKFTLRCSLEHPLWARSNVGEIFLFTIMARGVLVIGN